MTTISGSKDCGNSPRNGFVEKIAIALTTGRAEEGDFSEDVIWEGSLVETVEGRRALFQALANQPKPDAVTIDHAISHGKTGAANGRLIFANGNVRRFCHVLEFTSAKANCISMIKSFA